MTGNKESVDRGGGGWLETPLSCAITPDDVPADTAWKAFTATGWVAVPEVSCGPMRLFLTADTVYVLYLYRCMLVRVAETE